MCYCRRCPGLVPTATLWDPERDAPQPRAPPSLAAIAPGTSAPLPPYTRTSGPLGREFLACNKGLELVTRGWGPGAPTASAQMTQHLSTHRKRFHSSLYFFPVSFCDYVCICSFTLMASHSARGFLSLIAMLLQNLLSCREEECGLRSSTVTFKYRLDRWLGRDGTASFRFLIYNVEGAIAHLIPWRGGENTLSHGKFLKICLTHSKCSVNITLYFLHAVGGCIAFHCVEVISVILSSPPVCQGYKYLDTVINTQCTSLLGTSTIISLKYILRNRITGS